MTEAEWLACARPDLLLHELNCRRSLPSCRRKLRRFICACCRLRADLRADSAALAAIEAGERYADRQITPVQRDDARFNLARRGLLPFRGQPAFLAVLATVGDQQLLDAFGAVALLADARTRAALGPEPHLRPGWEWRARRGATRVSQ